MEDMNVQVKDDSYRTRIRKLEFRNKGLIFGIFGAAAVLVVVVILVITLRPSKCDDSTKSNTEALKKTQDLKIGLLFASKGERSSRERSLKEASLMAIKDATDSQKGLEIRTFVEDTESSPEKALEAFKRLYTEKQVKFFVGLSNSEAIAVATWAETNANDTIIITPHATTTELAKYSNVVQLSMTTQAFAHALHSRFTDAKVFELIPIVQDNKYTLEVVEELTNIVESLVSKLKVAAPIKYLAAGLENKADEVVAQVREALKLHPNASIFLVGQNEAKFILEAAHGDPLLLRRMWYASDELGFNNALLNSSKALNVSQIVSLYSLIYAGDQFGKSKKRGRTFFKLSELLNEPPSLQAAMAYDAVRILYDTARATNGVNPTEMRSELRNKEDWGAGLSGQISVDEKGRRTSGEYLRVVVLPNIPDERMVQVMSASKWYIDGTIRVSKTDFMAKYGKRSADDGVMSQVLSMTSSQSLGMSTGAVVSKSDLLNLQRYLNTTCNDVKIGLDTYDPFSYQMLKKAYDNTTFPKMVVLPAVHGYQMRITCEIPTGQLTYEVACPPSENPMENVGCVGVLTRPKGRRKLLLSGATTGAIATCAGTAVGCGVCAGVLGFFTLGIGAAACIGPCAVGIGGSCTAATTLGIKEGSGTVICTELLEQGKLPLHLFLHDVSFGKRLARENSRVFKGYHALAKPIVWLMQRSEFVTSIVETFALPWAEEMGHLEGEGESNNLGRLVMKVGIPLCTVVGYMVEAWEAVAASVGGMTILGSLLVLGLPLYHLKKA